MTKASPDIMEVPLSTGDVDWDVIVIGAGLSGLTAAYRLKQQQPNCRVLVLEAKDRVGGRTFSAEMEGANGKDVWDLGGQWVGSTQHHIMWLLEELGLEKYQQYTTGRKLMLLGNKGIRTYEASIPSLALLPLLDIGRFFNTADSIASTVPLDNPMNAPNADVLDSMTLDTVIRQNTWTKEARDLIDAGIYMVMGAQPRTLSALYFFHYVGSTGNMKTVMEATQGSSQELKVKGGVHQISSILAERIGLEKVLLKQPVCHIQQEEGGVHQISSILAERIGLEKVLLKQPVCHIQQEEVDRVTVVTKGGKDFSCRYVIAATPLHCSTDIIYTPVPPLARISLACHAPMGHLFKFIVTYKTAFWREDGLSGEVVSHGGEPRIEGLSSGPLQITFDSTSSNGNPALVGFYANGREWSDVEEEVRKAAIIHALSEFFGPKALEPLDYREKDWALEPYNGGCPVNCMTPGAMTYFHKGLRTPFDRVHWAGTESATQHIGYLSGAVQSGMRAADEVLGRLDPTHIRDEILFALDNKRLLQARHAEQWGWVSLGSMIGVVALAALVVKKVWYD